MKAEISLYYGGTDARAAVRLFIGAVRGLASHPVRPRRGFEREIKRTLPAREVRLFNSGRAALCACLRAARIGAGHEVVVAGFTCAAVPTAVRTAGAVPVYADIAAGELNSSASTVQPVLSPKTRAIVIQHTLGGNRHAEEIVALARARGLLVIEDAALALGSTVRGRPVGLLGDAAVFSLELSKTLTTGSGGILLVHDASLSEAVAKGYTTVAEPGAAQTIRAALQTAFCALAYEPALFPFAKYAVAALYKLGLFRPSTPPDESCRGLGGVGFVERMGGPQAALGAVQWRRLSDVAQSADEKRRRLASALRARGAQVFAEDYGQGADIVVAPRVAWMVPDRRHAVEWFRGRGIELGCWFDAPVSPMPNPPNLIGYSPGNCPNAEALASHVVNLPVHGRIRERDLGRMMTAIGDYLSSASSLADIARPSRQHQEQIDHGN